jgi:hypothetical protein
MIVEHSTYLNYGITVGDEGFNVTSPNGDTTLTTGSMANVRKWVRDHRRQQRPEPPAGARFVVLETEGFLDAEPASRKLHNLYKHDPHLSAMVYDTAWDRIIATYRSEEQNGRWTKDKRDTAILLAHEHADRLNAEDEPCES